MANSAVLFVVKWNARCIIEDRNFELVVYVAVLTPSVKCSVSVLTVSPDLGRYIGEAGGGDNFRAGEVIGPALVPRYHPLESCGGTNTCPHPRPSPHLPSQSPPHPHYYFQYCPHPRPMPVAFIPIPAPSPQQSFPSPTVPADDCSHASPQNHRHISNKIE